MSIVARPNRDAVNRALDVFRDVMRPFIVRSLKRVPGMHVEDVIRDALNDRQADQFIQNLDQSKKNIEAAIDIDEFPMIIGRNWHDIFRGEFKGERNVQNALWLIKEARDKAAHPGQQDMDAEFARTHLFHIADVLGRINKPDQKREVESIRDHLTGPSSPGDTAVPEHPESVPATRPSNSSGNLTPWRTVIRPNTDVQQGTFEEAEFAADLQQVYDGRASATNYGNPVSFFNQTHITPGIRTLLTNTLKRLNGKGGHPVIQTKTGFGGGKTHSLIALYHLVNSVDALTNPTGTGQSGQTCDEIRSLMAEAGVETGNSLQARVAVLDGTYLSSTDTNTTREKRDPLNTLWGVMAYQLGGQDAYDIVGQSAREGIAPGGALLDRIFAHVGPCVILVDELVAYVRNVEKGQDNIYTFIQALTQSVRRNVRTSLVVTLPESSIEAGGDAGMEALSRLEHLLGRIEAIWEPLEVKEAFEVVRRRLFGSNIDEAERNRTCEAFSRMYNNSRSDYPRGTSEQRYLERLKACYPIHPEIFDRLYEDWSSIPHFQRTRGVLRMMAHCVSRLYLNGDSSPLILPGNLTLSDTALASEFARLLGNQWGPVLSEVDSDGSRTDNIDRSYQRFASVGGAARRIARTVFLGSSASGAVNGIDARQIRVGVVQPGQGVSVYNEALDRMAGDLYYLYISDDRYYFHAEENLNKVATDRAGTLNTREINACIRDELKEAVGNRSDVLIHPEDSGDVPEKDSVRLVILSPGESLPSRSSENDDATPEALQMLKKRGDSDRVRRNTLLFLASKKDEIRNLRNAIRQYLAWHSIVNGEYRLENLSGDRLKQAQNSIRRADSVVRSALVGAYRWAMVPVQGDPQKAEYRLNSMQIGVADTGDFVQSAFETLIEEEALVENISASVLGNMLDQYVWNNEPYRDHIDINALWDLITSNVYMHRLRNKTVLMKCIGEGVIDSKFGYAESHHKDDYKGLRFGQSMLDILTKADSNPGLLVNPVMAQLVQEETTDPTDRPGKPVPKGPPKIDDPAPLKRGPTRITATKTMDGEISLDEINSLREEIIRNLRDDGGVITVSISIFANKADGFSESTTRSVRENSNQLDIEFVESE